MNEKFKRNHKIINEDIKKTFGYGYYNQGNFTRFYKVDKFGYKNEIGFIEKIKASTKYMKIIYIQFFDFGFGIGKNEQQNKMIENRIYRQYKQQRKDIQGVEFQLQTSYKSCMI